MQSLRKKNEKNLKERFSWQRIEDLSWWLQLWARWSTERPRGGFESRPSSSSWPPQPSPSATTKFQKVRWPKQKTSSDPEKFRNWFFHRKRFRAIRTSGASSGPFESLCHRTETVSRSRQRMAPAWWGRLIFLHCWCSSVVRWDAEKA